MIRSVSVANLGPFYGEQSANLGTGIISIEGRFLDKPGESNRAGKSAFIDLIRFGLYGQHRHQTLAAYINKKANPKKDPVYVSLEMENPDGEVYHVIREFDYTGQRFILRIPESTEAKDLKQGELQKYLEDTLLHCDYNSAIKTWLVLQNDAPGIMKMSIADRKKFLLDLFAPSMFPWNSYYTEANTRYTIAKTRLSEVNGRIINYRNRLYELSNENLSSAITDAQQHILDLQQRQDEIQRTISDLRTLSSPEAIQELSREATQRKQRLTDMYNALLLSRKTLDKLNRDVDTFNAKSSVFAELQKQQKSLNQKMAKLRIKETEEEYGQVYDEHEAEAAKLSLALQQYKSIEGFSGVCPVTKLECESGGAICDYKAQLERDIQAATAKVDALQSRIDTLAAVMDANDKVRRDLAVVESNIQAIKNLLDHLSNAKELYDEHKLQNKADEEAYARYKTATDEFVADLEIRRNEHDLTYQRRLRELNQELATVRQEIQETNNRIKLLISDEQRKAILEQDMADAQREANGLESRIQILQAMRPMLSQDGIPFTYLLASVTGFEKAVNEALADLGADITIDIEPYTLLKTYATVCGECGYEYAQGSHQTRCPNITCGAPREHKKRETLEFRLMGNLHDVTYDEDSGGGQQWVSMGVRFALYKILQDRGLMQSIDFWSLDEVFAPLSDAGKFRMLSDLENNFELFGIRQLFLITHTDISSVLPPSVIIERSDALQESHILT